MADDTEVAIILGTISHEGFMSPLTAINIIALGSFLGDYTGFLFGKFLKKLPRIQKLMSIERHQKKWDLFDRHIALVIIFGKLLPVVRSAPSLFAGTRNISRWKYAIYTLVGSYLWAIVGIIGGRFIGKVLGKHAIPFVVIGIIIMFFITWVSVKLKSRYKNP